MEKLKITAHLKYGQLIYHHELYFDSILYSCKLKKDMENWYNRETKTRKSEEENQMQLPIKRHTDEVLYSFDHEGKKHEHYAKNSGVRLASQSIISPLGEQKIYINKRFQSLRYEQRGGIEKKNVYLSMGKYKNYMIPTKIILAPFVQRIVVGEKQKIQEMLDTITHIGKENNLGYGRVERWTIEPTTELGLRHFPSRHYASHEIIEHKRCLPPYSKKEYIRECSKRYF